MPKLTISRALLIIMILIAASANSTFAGAPPLGPSTLIQTGGLATPEINASNAILNSTTSYTDYTLKQNGAAVFDSEITGAITNTLHLKQGRVGIDVPDPDVTLLIAGYANVVPFATSVVIEPVLNETTGSGYGANGLLVRPEFRSSSLGGGVQKGIWIQNMISHTEAQTVSELDGIRIDGPNFAKTGTNAITSANGLYVVAPTIGTTNYAILAGGEVVIQGDLGDSAHKVNNVWVVTNHVGDVDFSNNWSLNETYNGAGTLDGVQLRDSSNQTALEATMEGTQLSHGPTLPPCDVAHREFTYTLDGDSTNPDRVEVCLRSASGSYAWHVIVSG